MSRFLAIDADLGGIHVAVGTAARGGAVRLDKALTVPVAEPLSPATAADLGRQLRDALKAAGVAPAPVVAAVGRDRVIVKDVKIPRVGPAEEPSLVKFQATKDATEAPDTVVLDYYSLARDEPDGQVRTVTVSVRKDLVAAYKALCQAAGLKLAGITPRPLGTLAALDRAVSTGAVTAPEARHTSVAVLARGEKWGELVVARDGQAVFSRSMSATALNSEPMLLGELRRNLAVYNGQSPQQPVEAVYVAEAGGPGGWSGRIRAGLQVPVQAFDPLDGLPNDTPPEARGHYAALTGLLVLKAGGGRLPIDFASPREPVVVTSPARRLVAAGVAVLALLIVGGLGLGYFKVNQRQAEFARLVKQKVDLDKELKDLEDDDKRMKALNDWDRTRVNWLDELYDQTARFPDVKNARVELFRGEPVAIAKGPQPKNAPVNVARMTLKVSTDDRQIITALQGAMAADKKYNNVKPEIKTNTGFRGGFSQTFEIKAEIERRQPKEYTRELKAPVPPRPSRGRDDGGSENGFGRFGVGFGGADQ